MMIIATHDCNQNLNNFSTTKSKSLASPSVRLAEDLSGQIRSGPISPYGTLLSCFMFIHASWTKSGCFCDEKITVVEYLISPTTDWKEEAMKASIRHVMNPPNEVPVTLRERIIHSTSPIDVDNDDSQNFDSSNASLNHNNNNNNSMTGFQLTASSLNSSVTSVSASSSLKAMRLFSAFSSSASCGVEKILEIHPSRPLLCYVDTNGSDYHLDDHQSSSEHQQSSSSSFINSNSSIIGASSQTVHHTNTNTSSKKNLNVTMMMKQRIIFQNHLSNQTVGIITMMDIVSNYFNQINDINKTQNSGGSNKQRNNNINASMKTICQTLGFITSIQFMDEYILLHESGRMPPSKKKKKSMSPLSPILPPSPYIIIHFQNRVILYPIDSLPNSTCSNTTATNSAIPATHPLAMMMMKTSGPHKQQHLLTQNQNHEIIDITKSTLNKSNITSKYVLPILSTNLLAVGCSDGAMRFYSKLEQKIIKSVRGPNGKTDPVVGMLSVNSWDWSSFHEAGEDIYSDEYDDDNYDVGGDDNNNNHNHRQRDGPGGVGIDSAYGGGTSSVNHTNEPCTTNKTSIMTVCSSGTAYVWELQVAIGNVTGSPKKLNILPPLVKLDCISCITSAVGGGVVVGGGTNTNLTSLSPSSLGGGGGVGSSGTSGVNGAVQRNSDNVKYDPDRQLLYWTLQPSQTGLSKAYVLVWDMSPASIAQSQKFTTARIGKQSESGGGGNSQITPIHYPCSIIQIPSGDFLLADTNMISGLRHPSLPGSAYTCLAVSKDGNISLIASNCCQTQKQVGSNALSLKKMNETASVYHHFTISAMKRSADEKVLGNLRFLGDDFKLRVSNVISSYSRPDVIVLSTNAGLVVVTLNDDALVTGSIHSCFTSAKTNSNGFIGLGNKVLMVKDSSVLKGKLDFNETAMIPNPIGTLGCKDVVLFYRSPPPLHKSVGFQARPVRMPPRLLPSPSGNFLCLFWHTENRYEIIHSSSITSAARKSTLDEGPEYSPAVDTGSNALSFAWVGDGDVFALLYPPELSKNDSGTFSKKKSKSTPKADVEDDDEDNAPIDPSKYKPRVELKVLVGVNKDAVEYSISVAAATARSLGTLSLRGRHSPTCLFGGPVLCVGSLSQDKESSQKDGMAYFYTRRQNVEENDNRALSFSSVGPPLPYPDLVVWDDDGKICALIVGRRIAIYLSDPPNFTLLCTTHLGTPTETDAKVQSAKFLHGVLYCTTQTSVQCVFLGDLENDDVVCEVDSYILASADAPLNRVSSSIQPHAQTMPLIRPSILDYLHGSLLVSTVNGVHAISLSYPLIRIGALLASGHYTRAQRWFDTIKTCHHEALANFLDRRGFPEMAVELPGLSLQTIIDFSLRYSLTDCLMNVIEQYGLENFHMIDMGRGVNGDGSSSQSILVCIGAYLLSRGKDSFVLQMANVCLTFGESGRKEAFTLATLLIENYPSEARELIHRAITEHSPNSKPLVETWPVAMYIRNQLL